MTAATRRVLLAGRAYVPITDWTPEQEAMLATLLRRARVPEAMAAVPADAAPGAKLQAAYDAVACSDHLLLFLACFLREPDVRWRPSWARATATHWREAASAHDRALLTQLLAEMLARFFGGARTSPPSSAPSSAPPPPTTPTPSRLTAWWHRWRRPAAPR